MTTMIKGNKVVKIDIISWTMYEDDKEVLFSYQNSANDTIRHFARQGYVIKNNK